jgi:FkbM family methyltransferase
VTTRRHHPFDAVPPDLQARWIMDVGANIGDVTVAGLESYPGSHVICFEPVRATFEHLARRTAPYGDRVVRRQHALGDTRGTAEINLTSFHGANSIAPQAEAHRRLNPHVREVGRETIRLERLDDIAGELPPHPIDLMKIDVEGFELEVLRGGARFIAERVDTLIIEVSLMRDPSFEHQQLVDIFALLDRLGFALINCYDLHHDPSARTGLMLVQMDCVFRRKARLMAPRGGAAGSGP